jgi:hypothetical protein
LPRPAARSTISAPPALASARAVNGWRPGPHRHVVTALVRFPRQGVREHLLDRQQTLLRVDWRQEARPTHQIVDREVVGLGIGQTARSLVAADDGEGHRIGVIGPPESRPQPGGLTSERLPD